MWDTARASVAVSHYTFTPKEVVSVAAKLTPKQRRFVNEYLIDLNATQAAIRAGYSKKTAQQIGAENLSKPVMLTISEEKLKRIAPSVLEKMVLQKLKEVCNGGN